MIENHLSGIKYQVSSIKYQVSSIKYHVLSIKYQVSSIKYQVSMIRVQVEAGESKLLLFETFSLVFFFPRPIPRGARAPKKQNNAFV